MRREKLRITIKNPLGFRTQGIGRRPWLTSHLLGEEAVIKAPSERAECIDHPDQYSLFP
ncbi:hypothetical protein PMIT1342_01465 [Prochlorococcus marinus str. MIT 1342]|nr:hypothetical protein PMIT1312_02323 [Prochlorococcus marinus str. MIT 1312]KZR66099.1 hypothetical protein PMIT1303_01067 [Prochlorococcus sp. MIT 1303]KZR79510.1 hypothetical protein PMIT1327_01569 [Prochlorococcus marinus str. MIT 1327]KZR81130.1 hypothetical protein PMIT1342_01465 [Prochlorococcus marinus str. MIT 1342]CAI8221877.1 MAG: Uncharacterised protein [Prochlorococcus marinus str. MIT 9313]